MKLEALIQEAVNEKCPYKACKVADICRFKLGLNYAQTVKLVEGFSGISASEWEQLLYHGDCESQLTVTTRKDV